VAKLEPYWRLLRCAKLGLWSGGGGIVSTCGHGNPAAQHFLIVDSLYNLRAEVQHVDCLPVTFRQVILPLSNYKLQHIYLILFSPNHTYLQLAAGLQPSRQREHRAK
jgi:hypothetical protein